MNLLRLLLPPKRERRVLGRFYLSCVVSEFLNLIQPFQFVYLFLVLDRPEWAAIPLMVESLIVFALEIPTGVIADRWGRKTSVVLGEVLSGVGWMIAPCAMLLHGVPQLIVACLAFAFEGLGRTLVSGAEEAWVMDNLIASGREDLTERYFARERSVSSLGGVVSGLAVWAVLLTLQASAGLMATVWIVAAAGQFASAAILATVPELRVSRSPHAAGAPGSVRTEGSLARTLSAARSFVTVKPLLAFTVIGLIISFARSVSGDAFDISLITKGLDARNLAPLTILKDVIGVIVPLGGVALSRRLGRHRALGLLLVVTAGASAVLFLQAPLLAVVGLYLLFDALDGVSGPIRHTIEQGYYRSTERATASSIAHQLSELSRTIGLGVFALILGRHSSELKAAVPDLVGAFAGGWRPPAAVPVGALGLPVADGAIVIFAGVGLAAALLLFVFPWNRYARSGSRRADSWSSPCLQTRSAKPL